MAAAEELPFLSTTPVKKPSMIRRFRTSFLAFVILTLCISLFLLWNYGTSLPRTFYDIEETDGKGQDGAPIATVAPFPSGTQNTVPVVSPVPQKETGSNAVVTFDLPRWLSGIHKLPGKTMVLTIANDDEMDRVYNMREHLRRMGRSDEFIVLCAETKCMSKAAEFNVFDASGYSKSAIKLYASAQMLDHGYDFVYMSTDIFLTGFLNPFDDMRDLSDESWEIQFFPGAKQGQYGIDSAFYYARPCQATNTFFAKCKKMWRDSGFQSAQEIMNEIGRDMVSNQNTLKMRILSPDSFRNWADCLTWETTAFYDRDAINRRLRTAAAYRMTCSEKSMQPYMAKLFGAWYDNDGYYSTKRKLLGIKGIQGDYIHVQKMIAFAAKVAQDTDRAFIFPSSVTLTQARKNPTTGASDYVTVEHFPGFRVIDPSSLETLKVDVVESMYLNNRARYRPRAPTTETIIMGNGHSVKDPKDGKPVLVRTIQELDQEVIWVDMGSGRWWDLDSSGAMAEYTRPITSGMRKCANVNEKDWKCGQRCT